MIDKRVSLSLNDDYQHRMNMLAIEFTGGNRSELMRRMIDAMWSNYSNMRVEQKKEAEQVFDALEEVCQG
jgi:hypothetical protein